MFAAKLPEKDEAILVYYTARYVSGIPVRGHVRVAFYDSDHKEWTDAYSFDVIEENPTHWMPLPRPPETP